MKMGKKMDALVDVSVIAAMCGAKPRTIKDWAAKGKIPGAHKLNGMWRFDAKKIKRWLFDKEVKPCLYISEVKSIGSTLPSMESTTANQLRQALGLKR
jgi:DNA-binding transcriptional MerR regulator